MPTRKRQEKELQKHYRREERAQRGLPHVEIRSRQASGHPWVYRRMLGGPYEDLEPGELVEASYRDGEFAGYGFYNAHSEIALRILSTVREQPVDAGWFARRIAEAVHFRREVLRLEEDNDAYRVIHSEGDGLSGLVVDRLGPVLVCELFSAGMHRCLDWIRAGLAEHFPHAEIVVRADRRSEKHEGVKMDGPPPSEKARAFTIREGRLTFHVDLRRGHKTGFFVDQRENRKRFADLCRGEDVFDGFCYTGGFALSAALGGAKQIEAVDLDEDVIEIAAKNRALNGIAPEALSFRHGNVFDVLREHRARGRRFTRMVLDPAKLAIARHEVPKALDAYADMNRLGMQCLTDGGVLVSCSCTGLVSEEDFLSAIRAAAAESGKDLQIFHVGGAAADHPWAARMPEGRYLKAVFARVRPLP